MVYFFIAAVQPHRHPAALGVIAGFLTSLVELSRLYHSPGLDAFRLTLAGALLLGRVYNAWHLLIYWIAALFGACTDGLLLRRTATQNRIQFTGRKTL